MIKTTKEQLKALLTKYRTSKMHSYVGPDPVHGFNVEHHYRSYRHFRSHLRGTFGCDGAVSIYWCNMWLCIEKDGYTHS
jgi:hypothetical protein